MPEPAGSRRRARSQRRILICCLAALTLAYPRDAGAYLDVGTTSVLLQAVIASIATAAFVAKSYWHRLKRIFAGRRDDPSAPADESDESLAE